MILFSLYLSLYLEKIKFNSTITLESIKIHFFFFLIQAKASQQPLVHSGKSMVNSSTNLFLAAKQLAGNNKDSNSWNSFAQYARAVSDAMKKIVFSLR